MRPEASAFLGKAREFLLKAEDMFADGWPMQFEPTDAPLGRIFFCIEV